MGSRQLIEAYAKENGCDLRTEEGVLQMTVDRLYAGDPPYLDHLEGLASEVSDPHVLSPAYLILPASSPLAAAGLAMVEVLGIPIKVMDGIDAPLLSYCTLGPEQHCWPKAHSLALRRDGHACVICGETEKLHVHHKVPVISRGNGCRHHVDGLVTLCASHHRRIHAEINASRRSCGHTEAVTTTSDAEWIAAGGSTKRYHSCSACAAEYARIGRMTKDDWIQYQEQKEI